MRILLLFVIVCATVVSAGRPRRPARQFQKDNMEKVRQFFRKQARGAKWEPAENELTGLEEGELKPLCGTIRPTKESKANDPHIAPAPLLKRVAIPASFDARLNWPSCASIKDIRDQGQCGSCWAHAGASALSDRYCIASGSAATYKKFSVQDLIVCSGGQNKNWCDGNDPRVPYAMFVSNGLVTGGDYQSTGTHQGCMPYTSYPNTVASVTSTNQCTNQCTNSAVNYQADKAYGSTWYALGNNYANNSGGAAASIATTDTVIHQIQYELMTNGPMTISIDVYGDFFSYGSGVYQHVTGNFSGGHAMKLIGWGTESNTDYWLIANSWGPNWGINGTLKFIRGTNHLGIEDYVVAGLANPSATATTASIPCNAYGCQGRSRYAMASTSVCSTQYCTCSYQSGVYNSTTGTTTWVNVNAPKVFNCSAGMSFDASPSVLACVSTSNVQACTGITTTPGPTTTTTTQSTTPISAAALLPSDWCDATFCSTRGTGYYATAPCGKNYCNCTSGAAGGWYGCAVGQMFDDVSKSCKAPSATFCTTKPAVANSTVWTAAPANIANVCTVANCQKRDLVSNWWFSIGKCSPYWCYCDITVTPLKTYVQTCPTGQMYDFRSETSACKDISTIQWC